MIVLIVVQALARFTFGLLDDGACDRENSIFLKSTSNMLVEDIDEINKWEKPVAVRSGIFCPGQCQALPECKSTSYENGKCFLRNVDRFSMNAKITMSTNNMDYYEKQECSYNITKSRFVSVIEDSIDCKDIHEKGWKQDGVYAVNIPGKKVYQPILCKMSLLGGGWTVVQQRVKGNVDFNRAWMEYKKGFGTLKGDFWYGNDRLHQLTNNTSNEILFELEDELGVHYYPLYDEFKVASETDLYKVNIGNYKYVNKGKKVNGNADKGFHYNRNMDFSTNDKDHDVSQYKNCGNSFGSGWWFRDCTYVNLNGKFGIPTNYGIKWAYITYKQNPESFSSLKSTKMMIRKKE